MKTDVQIQEFNKVPDYNDYTNKPTWTVSLWINNDQSLQSQVLALARSTAVKHSLSNLLENMFSDTYNPLIDTATLYTDLLNWALAYVDWDELAEHFINDAKEITD